MEYPLKTLLFLREGRVDKATREQRACRQKLEMALAFKEKCEQELRDYKVFKQAEIERRYEAILNTVMSQKQITEFNHNIASLDLKEADLMQAVIKAQQDIDVAKSNYDKSTLAVQLAQKAVLKLQKHQEQWLALDKLEQEQKADLELEDFKVKVREDF